MRDAEKDVSSKESDVSLLQREINNTQSTLSSTQSQIQDYGKRIYDNETKTNEVHDKITSALHSIAFQKEAVELWDLCALAADRASEYGVPNGTK